MEPQLRLTPNPLWEHTPSAAVLWPYSRTFEDLFSPHIPTGTPSTDIHFSLYNDGASFESGQGSGFNYIHRLAFGGVGTVHVKKVPVARVRFGGRIPAPQSIWPHSSAEAEGEAR